MKTVAIVIPCLNEKDYILRCLESISQQSYNKDLITTYVCDGGSNDGTIEIIKDFVKSSNRFLILNNNNKTTPYALNLGITESNGANTYQVLNADITFTKNKLSFHYVDLPIELRWRNSTPESHIFWRVYSGLKLSYLFYDEYKSVTSSGTVTLSNNKDLNKFQYGVYLTVGWNTWNFYAYYGMNPLFKSSAKIANQSIDMNTTNFGLMFYIL